MVCPVITWVDADFQSLLQVIHTWCKTEGGRQIKVWWVPFACFFTSPLASLAPPLNVVLQHDVLPLTFGCQCFCDICYIHWYFVHSKMNSLTTAFECFLNTIITLMYNLVYPLSLETTESIFFLKLDFRIVSSPHEPCRISLDLTH